MAEKSKLKKWLEKATNLTSSPYLKAAFDAVGRVMPNNSKNEEAIRAADRAAVSQGKLGEPVVREASLVDGHLNRNKILIGTAAFYEYPHFTREDAKLINDAGFDFIITVAGGTFRDNLLDWCGEEQVAVIAKDSSLPGGEQVRDMKPGDLSLFSSYNKHPAQVGDCGWDEPNSADFGCIGEYTRLYREALPEQFLFNNLFPDGATKKQLGAENYRDYVNKYADAVPADYLSLDIYPFYFSSLLNKVGFMLCLNTYDCVAEACRSRGRDFWLYIQTQGLWFSHLYLLVTFEQIKWQFYTALAYGARSVIQVNYTPVWGDDAYAMKDRDGRLTEQYLYAKRINAEIQKLSPVLCKFRSLGVMPAKTDKNNPDFALAVKRQEKANASYSFNGIAEVRSVRSESSALTGFFAEENGNAKGMMIVNCRDCFDSTASQKITVTLTRPCRVTVYQKGEKIDTRDVKEKFSVNPDSCDGIFVVLE